MGVSEMVGGDGVHVRSGWTIVMGKRVINVAHRARIVLNIGTSQACQWEVGVRLLVVTVEVVLRKTIELVAVNNVVGWNRCDMWWRSEGSKPER